MGTTHIRVWNSDALAAAVYWRDKEWKKWAVDVMAGPHRRPSYSCTVYVRARTGERAIACAKANMLPRPPRSARYAARLAGPYELGCIPAVQLGNLASRF